MQNTDLTTTLWSAVYSFKKDFFSKLLKEKILKVRKDAKSQSDDKQKEIEVAAAREVLSSFIIKIYADFDVISKNILNPNDIDSFWNEIGSKSSPAFKEWIVSTMSSLDNKAWHGTAELQKNIDDFLERATRYHSQMQKNMAATS